jgi:glutamyl-tRNA reductase
VQRVSEELLALTFARPSPYEAGWLAQAAREHLVLSTCERFEIYLAGAAAGAPSLLAPCGVRRDGEAARHLFRVAAGLESRLVGEPQILGQLRAAFLAGSARRSLGPVLSALARAALHAGRRARCETGLGRAPTIVTLTLARLSQELGGLRRRAVLVAGTGALAAEIAPALRAAGAGRLYVLSREPRRADALAARVAGVGVGDAGLAALAPLDAVVTCSNRLVPLAEVAAAPGARGRRLAIVDLGAPPNVALAQPQLTSVSLARLGELSAAAAAGDDPARRSAIAAAEALLERELERFLRWRRARALHGAAAARRAAA